MLVASPSHRFILMLAALVGGLSACGDSRGDPGPVSKPKPAKSRALAEIQHQGSQLLGGGVSAFDARVRGLRGFPIVVNQWASWCPPCRREFPFFEREAAKYGTRVAFLGVDSRDARGDAQSFLRQLPTPYPHYFDPDAAIARVFGGGRAWPTTAVYDPRGKVVYRHLGGYPSQAKLEQDIKTHALHG